MALSNPYNQYKQTQISTATQGRLIVMLYEGAIKFLTIAKENMTPKKYEVVNMNIQKAQDIISELMTSLNMDQGGEIAKNLLSLYIYFKKRLLEANMKKDADILDEVLKLMTQLCDSWEKIAANDSENSEYASAKGNFSIEG